MRPGDAASAAVLAASSAAAGKMALADKKCGCTKWRMRRNWNVHHSIFERCSSVILTSTVSLDATRGSDKRRNFFRSV